MAIRKRRRKNATDQERWPSGPTEENRWTFYADRSPRRWVPYRPFYTFRAHCRIYSDLVGHHVDFVPGEQVPRWVLKFNLKPGTVNARQEFMKHP